MNDWSKQDRVSALRAQHKEAPDLVEEIRELRRQLYDTRALLAYLISDRMGGRVFVSREVSEMIDPETAELTWYVNDKGERCITAAIALRPPAPPDTEIIRWDTESGHHVSAVVPKGKVLTAAERAELEQAAARLMGQADAEAQDAYTEVLKERRGDC